MTVQGVYHCVPFEGLPVKTRTRFVSIAGAPGQRRVRHSSGWGGGLGRGGGPCPGPAELRDADDCVVQRRPSGSVSAAVDVGGARVLPRGLRDESAAHPPCAAGSLGGRRARPSWTGLRRGRCRRRGMRVGYPDEEHRVAMRGAVWQLRRRGTADEGCQETPRSPTSQPSGAERATASADRHGLIVTGTGRQVAVPAGRGQARLASKVVLLPVCGAVVGRTVCHGQMLNAMNGYRRL